MIEKAWRRAQRLAWGIMLLVLPITSMPVVIRLVGSDTVAAPSGLLLLFLTAGWLLPRVLGGMTLPRQSLPLLALGLVAVLSTTASAFLEFPPYKDVDILANQLKALLTLAIGVSFYLVAAAWPQRKEQLQGAFQLINWSGFLVIAWSLLQAVVWYTQFSYPDWLRAVHEIYSIGPLYRQRVTGFTLEPSWLAHQLNLFYLPWWLAATVRRFSVHRFRILKLSFENLLLAGGVAVLGLTLSRIGLLAFLLMAAYLLISANLWLARRIQKKVMQRWRVSPELQKRAGRLAMAGIFVVLFTAYVGVLLGVGWGLSQVDPRMRELFRFTLQSDNPILSYASRLTFAARLVYWQAGWEVFNEHPWLGVGLGNAGFYFPEKMSDYAWGLMEVRDLFFRSDTLLNIKSIWVRILAETGLIGFAFFIGWCYLLWQSARFTEGSGDNLLRSLALAGQLALAGLLAEGFSVDSFAFPYFWVLAGLATAACNIFYTDIFHKDATMRENRS